MEFETVKVAKLSETIVDQLEEMILDGVLKAGDKLPPERELAQQLQVSRPSLREALVILEAKGLLQARRGGGTYVCDVVAQIITDPLVHLLKRRPETTEDVLELRLALEEVAAYFAALRANAADREILQRRWKTLEASYEGNDRTENAEADVEFHMAVADASHNVAVSLVMRGLFNLLRTTILDSLEKIYAEAGSIEFIRKQHQSLLTAILNGDAATAREAAHTHIAFVAATVRQANQQAHRHERSQRRLKNLALE